MPSASAIPAFLLFLENTLLVAGTFSAFYKECFSSFVCMAGLFCVLASRHNIEAERVVFILEVQVQHWEAQHLGPLRRVMPKN